MIGLERSFICHRSVGYAEGPFFIYIRDILAYFMYISHACHESKATRSINKWPKFTTIGSYMTKQGRTCPRAEGGHCPPPQNKILKKKSRIKILRFSLKYIYIYIFVSPLLKYLDIDLQENK